MPGMEWAWLIPVLSFTAFPLIALFHRVLPGRGSFLAILAIAAGFALFWFVLRAFLAGDSQGCGVVPGDTSCSMTWFEAGNVTLTWGMIIDPLALVMLGLVTFVALMVQVYSLDYMKGDARFGLYFAFHALFAASMITLVLADNFLLLYIAWELVGLCSYLLIGHWYERRSAAEAAKKAFITTRLGDVGLLIGILLLFHNVGTFSMSETFQAVEAGAIGSGTLTLAAILIFLGAMGKSAQFPFHVWLPDAMEGPTPVSALIHATTMVVAGVYLVARTFPIFEASPSALLLVTTIGLITTLMASTMALVMTDIKRILAYSTISHLGLMMLSLGAFGFTAAIFHLLAHGFSKALLFMGAGSVMHSMADETDIRKMGGLRRVMPFTALTFSVGALSLAGIPLFAGFWSKDEVLVSVLEGRNPVFFALTLVAVFLSAMYMARALFMIFFGQLKDENRHLHEAPPTMALALGALAILSLGFGFIALNWPGSFGGLGSFLFLHEIHTFTWNAGVTVASILLAVGAFALGWRIYVSRRISLEPWQSRFAGALKVVNNKYYMDNLYQWVVDRVVLAFSTFIALFDRIVVNDTGVNGIADSVRRSGNNLRYHVTGRVYNYALGMVVGAVVLGILWWALSSRL